MKLINYGETDWLIGDESADLLLEYAIIMAKGGTAGSVEMEVISLDGSTETVSFLLGPATMMTARSVASELPEPDNAEAMVKVRDRIQAIESPPAVQPSEAVTVLDDYEI